MAKTFIHQDSTIVDKYIYSQFIPYKELSPLVPLLTKDLDKPLLNIYIDLYSMILPLYNFYNFVNPLSLTSCMVNAAIHYRNFFKKYGIYTNITLLYSPTMSSNNLKHCPEYNKTNIEKVSNNFEVNKLVHENLVLLGIVVPYLPDIYFRMGTVETSIMGLDIMLNLSARNHNIRSLFVTSTPIAFQLPLMYDNVFVLMKKHNQDVMVIDKNNCLNRAVLYTKKQSIESEIDPKFLSSFYTLCGLRKRDVKSLLSYKGAFKIFKMMQDNAEMPYPDILSLYYIKYKEQQGSQEDVKSTVNTIHRRFQCFDFYQQLLLYRLLPESKETSYLLQLQDWEELLHINDKYFRDNPMQLDKL